MGFAPAPRVRGKAIRVTAMPTIMTMIITR